MTAIWGCWQCQLKGKRNPKFGEWNQDQRSAGSTVDRAPILKAMKKTLESTIEWSSSFYFKIKTIKDSPRNLAPGSRNPNTQKFHIRHWLLELDHQESLWISNVTPIWTQTVLYWCRCRPKHERATAQKFPPFFLIFSFFVLKELYDLWIMSDSFVLTIYFTC